MINEKYTKRKKLGETKKTTKRKMNMKRRRRKSMKYENNTLKIINQYTKQDIEHRIQDNTLQRTTIIQKRRRRQRKIRRVKKKVTD